MAFVNETQINRQQHIKFPASGHLGPGEYHNEGQLHKMAMEAIYPKKTVPFNSQQQREATDPVPVMNMTHTKSASPGPGAYGFRSEFDLNKYVRKMDEKGTYLTMENGHLNQKKQHMSSFKSKSPTAKNFGMINSTSKGRNENLTPGPGAYETNVSSITNKELTRKLMHDRTSKRNLNGSPSSFKGQISMAQTQGSTNDNNSGSIGKLQQFKFGGQMSIPSIPSRFLTPVLKFDLHEKEHDQSGLHQKSITDDGYSIYDTTVESVLVAKVARLTNDGSNLGPGAYNVDKASKTIAASPRMGVKWGNSHSKRPDFFTKTYTQKDVGPGKYSPLSNTLDRSINNPTIPRQKYQARTFAGGFKKKASKHHQTIRDDFDPDPEEEEEKNQVPGPGGYLKSYHANLFGQTSIIHKHPQNFGTTIGRFNDPTIGGPLGPGQYMSINSQPRADQKYLPQINATFAGSARNDTQVNKMMIDCPGPQDYMPDTKHVHYAAQKGGDTLPFGVNTMRFKKDDNGVPGPGNYKMPDSCKVKQSKHEMASYRSNVSNGLTGLRDIVIGPQNPGVGEYDTQHLKTIANKEFQGGAANNFVLFTRQNYQSRSPPIKQSPRLAKIEERTPANLGPGSYIDKKSHRAASITEPILGNKFSNNLHFGTSQRFTTDAKFEAQPGPGIYNDSNKWNKRTYNLKFLNFQAQSTTAVSTNATSNGRSFYMNQSLDAGAENLKGLANTTTGNNFNTIQR